MAENWMEVLAVLAEKIRDLKVEIYLKNSEIERLKNELKEEREKGAAKVGEL